MGWMAFNFIDKTVIARAYKAPFRRPCQDKTSEGGRRVIIYLTGASRCTLFPGVTNDVTAHAP